MNEFLPSLFVENVRRLALGLEPLDAERRTRIAHPIRVVFSEEARGLKGPKVDRHPSCLHALLYDPRLKARVRLRFLEDNRRFVPRLISYPIVPVAQAELAPHWMRVRHPHLFPGAAYDLTGLMTGVRGRVARGGTAVRWARIVATLPGTTTVVGRAQGDDRGEFLLLVSPQASPVAELNDPLAIRLTVTGPAIAPVPSTPDLRSLDPWWDLPEEIADNLDPNQPGIDTVSTGEDLPTGYTASVARNLSLPLGAIHSETAPFNLP